MEIIDKTFSADLIYLLLLFLHHLALEHLTHASY
jgi:hypothetical protein